MTNQNTPGRDAERVSLAEQLDTLRREHWTHWSAEENSIVGRAAAALRSQLATTAQAEPAIKSAFVLCLAALTESLQDDLDAAAKARWMKWIKREVTSIPDDATSGEVIDSAIAAFDAAQPASAPVVGVDAGRDDVMRHDFPALQQFHTKHAMGPLAAPSCFCCGQSTQGIDIGVRHLELPGIVICEPCKTAASKAKPADVPVGPVSVIPKGFALVPLRLTKEMDEVLAEEGWQWEDFLAAAGSITEAEYEEIATSSTPAPALSGVTDAEVAAALTAFNRDYMNTPASKRMRAALESFAASRALPGADAFAASGKPMPGPLPAELNKDQLYALQENHHILPPRAKRIYRDILALAATQSDVKGGV